MTPDELAALEEKMTEGPWLNGHDSWDGEKYMVIHAPDKETRVVMEPTDFRAYPSGAFISPDGLEANMVGIVALRNLAPVLIAAWRLAESLELTGLGTCDYDEEYLVAYRAAVAAQEGK